MHRNTRNASGVNPCSAACPVGEQTRPLPGKHGPPSAASSSASQAAASSSHLAYASENAERCTAWAATVSGMSAHPSMSSSPGGSPAFGPVGPPKNARAAYTGSITCS